jgi:hypothetical protein
MIQLPHIKARIDGLRELARGLGQEAAAQKDTDGMLAPLERHHYVVCMTKALAELEKARAVLLAADAPAR